MATNDPPAWIAAATAAAVRLAAEAGAEVDDVLSHGASPDLRAQQIVRLQQSAEITEVATDLAVLLWAECEDVPPITTILGEPETQAALEAVAEARRQAATRLARGGQPRVQPGSTVDSTPAAPHWADAVAQVEDAEGTGPPDEAAAPAPAPPGVVTSGPAAQAAPPPPAVAASAAAPEPAAPVPAGPAPPHEGLPGAVPLRRPATGAALAGAAAAILLFGRKLRRA